MICSIYALSGYSNKFSHIAKIRIIDAQQGSMTFLPRHANTILKMTKARCEIVLLNNTCISAHIEQGLLLISAPNKVQIIASKLQIIENDE